MHMRDRTYQRAVLRDGKSMQYMLGKSTKQTASSAARNLKYIILRSSKKKQYSKVYIGKNTCNQAQRQIKSASSVSSAFIYHRDLPFLITKRYCPNNSYISAFLSFKTIYIHLSSLASVLTSSYAHSSPTYVSMPRITQLLAKLVYTSLFNFNENPFPVNMDHKLFHAYTLPSHILQASSTSSWLNRSGNAEHNTDDVDGAQTRYVDGGWRNTRGGGVDSLELCQEGKARSLDIAPLTVLNSDTLQPRKWQLTGNDCSTAVHAVAAQSPR